MVGKQRTGTYVNRILFPAIQVQGIVEYAWRVFEEEYACKPMELETWPELAINGSIEGGIVLFPILESKQHGPRVYALGCNPNRDIGWRKNCKGLINGKPLVVPVPMESILACLISEMEFLEWLVDDDGESRIDPVSNPTNWSMRQADIEQKMLHRSQHGGFLRKKL